MKAKFPRPPKDSCNLVDVFYLGVSQNYGYLLGGPHNKDYSILRSILGSPYLGNYHLGFRTQGFIPIEASRTPYSALENLKLNPTRLQIFARMPGR